MTTNRVKKRSKVGDGVLQAVYICLGLTIAFPIIYAVLISFMEPSQVLAGGVNLIPKKWTLENYKCTVNALYVKLFNPRTGSKRCSSCSFLSGSFCICLFGFPM